MPEPMEVDKASIGEGGSEQGEQPVITPGPSAAKEGEAARAGGAGKREARFQPKDLVEVTDDISLPGKCHRQGTIVRILQVRTSLPPHSLQRIERGSDLSWVVVCRRTRTAPTTAWSS